MNKKILVMSILAVFMMVSISFVSSAEVNTDVEKKESPLYRIRTKREIREKLGFILENIKTRFLGERAFFLPFNRDDMIDSTLFLKLALKMPLTCGYAGNSCIPTY